MPLENQCLPFLPTILSLSLTIFMGMIAFIIHFSGDQQRRKPIPPKTKSRSVQTDRTTDTTLNASNMAKQLKHQKLVACNLEEENEALNEQVNTLKRLCAERKTEIAQLKEQLEEAGAKCEELAQATKKYQQVEKDAHIEKKSDEEFQSAMALLLDLAEQSVKRELRSVSQEGGIKKAKKVPTMSAEDFSTEDLAFLMNVVGLSDGEEARTVKLVKNQQVEISCAQMLYNERSPTAPGEEKVPKTFPDFVEEKFKVEEHTIVETPDLDLEENLSPHPEEDNEPGSFQLDPIEVAPLVGSWASNSSTPSFTERERSLNIHAKPFVPKKQQLQEEIQKRLQQWKDFYYTQVQPQEVASQQAAQAQTASWPDHHQPATNSRRSDQSKAAPTSSWMDQPPYSPTEYYGHSWDSAPVPPGYQCPQPSEVWYDPHMQEPAEDVATEMWPMHIPCTAACEGGWTTHQPYTCQCQCPSCMPPTDEGSTSADAHHTDRTSSQEESRRSSTDDGYAGEEYANDTIGLGFRFPCLPGDDMGWALAHEAMEPFYIARFTPASGFGCQVVVTEEYLQPPHTLSSYVELSKQQTERTLVAYNLMIESERQFKVDGHEAFEVIYSQGLNGDMLVWSCCIHAFRRVLTLQVVAANGTKRTILPALPGMLASIKLSPPQPLTDSPLGAACTTIQRVVRGWLARQQVKRLRDQQAEEELEENDVFIRVTTRINPKFSH